MLYWCKNTNTDASWIGAKLPLHDHPGMSVLTKVLWGEMKVTAFDRVAAGQTLVSITLVSITPSTPQYVIERETASVTATATETDRDSETETERDSLVSIRSCSPHFLSINNIYTHRASLYTIEREREPGLHQKLFSPLYYT